ncbi:MAG: hypothetical protein DRP87_06455 [Spirochaetes bacterium]|nr:MAG: hypothetical protein DRP87_06455 [Spirochaetota bacterium]
MNCVAEVEKLKDLLKEEIEFLNVFCKEQEKIKTFIKNKDWEGLNKSVQKIEALSEAIENIDKERSIGFNRLRKAVLNRDNASFYQVIVRLPEDEREVLASLYRKFKLTVCRLQGLTTGIETLVYTLSGTLNQFLEEIFPHRKGKIYTKNGLITFAEENPIVLNRET